MKHKLLVTATILLGLLGIVFLFSFLFTASWWFYALIYMVLLYIWYRPMLVFYHSLKAGHMLKKKDYKAVAQAYQHMATLKKNEGYGDYAKGLSYYYQKEFSKARQEFESALEKGIKTQKKTLEPLVKMALLTANMELKRWREAEKWINEIENEMDQGKRINPKLLTIYYPLKGEFLFQQKKEKEALRAFELGYARYPDLIGEEAYYYAQLLQQAGKTNQAKEILETLLDRKHEWKFFRINKKLAEELYHNLLAS